jgi:hypothetical protein
MRGDLSGWAAGRAGDLVARAEAEAVAELKAALIEAATARARPPRTREPEVEPPSGDALWAYCVARAGAEPEDGGAGVHPTAEVAWLREGELALLCSKVPLAEFGEEPLRRNLNDLAWLERVARAHEAAIERALERTTIVPLRLCTIFAHEDAARRMLAERAAELTPALDALDGRVEWSVKLLVDRERLEASLREPGAQEEREPTSGAAYMLVRREQRRLREAGDRRAAELAEDVHARLQDWADDARVRPAQNRELSGHEGDMVLNGAYLVERGKTAQLRQLVAGLQEQYGAVGARLELGGPFPPYNFVPEPPA